MSDIARRRLVAQRLVNTPFGSAAEVVAALGAVQAQDYGGAKWALAQRTVGATSADIERAFAEGTIVRTHVLRPTWHFVAPADIRWMLALTASRVRAAIASYDGRLGLDDDVYRRSNDVIARALEGGRLLERTALAQALTEAGIDTTGAQRLAQLVMRSELDAIVCSGPRRGNQFTYALLDERVPATSPLDRDDALGRLVARYFTTRGPATLHDFAWWSGLTVADVKRGVAVAGDVLARADIDGRPHWCDASAADASHMSTRAHLLPNYDELFIGFRDRGAVLERVKDAGFDARSAAFFGHVIAVNGQLVGGWKQTPSKRSVVIARNVLVRLTRAEEKAVTDAEMRYRQFLALGTNT